MNNSLSRSFEHTTETVLDNCDRAQFHLAGMIQQGNGLLVLDIEDNRIVAASANIDVFVDIPVDAILGFTLAVISPEIAMQINALEESPSVNHEILDLQAEAAGQVFDIVTHTHAGNRFIEFIRNDTPSTAVVRKRLRKCGLACAQIIGAVSFEEAMQIAVDAIRELTGLARVKIHRFLPDWSGSTVAESKADTMPSMLGMHFPNTDIPEQVRELMTIVPYRFIGSVEGDNIPIRALAGTAGALDMTWTMSRAVSTMHKTHLRNFGATSSFSCSLINKGNLWGFIACHHTAPHSVPSDSWLLVQEIATALMVQYDQSQRMDTANIMTQMRRIESDFAAQLHSSDDVEDVVKTLVPVLQKFLHGDGFAFQYGQNLHSSGDTPPDDFIRDLIRWKQTNPHGSEQFQTQSLQSVYPHAAKYRDVACGVLIQPIIVHRQCHLIWFRGPVTRHVTWAGRPDTKLLLDEITGVTLGPRASFNAWIEAHDDQSRPWEEAELDAAGQIFRQSLNAISSQLLLKEENTSLRQFAYMAAHDIKSPLRGIRAALEWMDEEEGDPESLRKHRQVAGVQAGKLQRLTESLLELSLLHEQKPEFQKIDISDVIGDACDLMRYDLDQANIHITIGTLPALECAPELLVRVFLNLIGNAVKYVKLDIPTQLDIFAEDSASVHRILIQDNGPGIETKYAERIFEPSQRLFKGAEVEGSGFGLTICAQIAKLHNGRIYYDTEYENGARFVLELPKAAARQNPPNAKTSALINGAWPASSAAL